MATTTYVNFTAGVRALGARTNSGGGAVNDLSAEEDRLVESIVTEGYLVNDNAFKVAATTGMVLNVGSGTIKSDLYAVEGEVAGQGTILVRLDQSPISVTVPAAEPAQARTDEIYLVVSDAAYEGGSVTLPRIGYRKGDPGGAAPGVDAAWKASVKLASVSVAAATSTITSGNITDSRLPAALAPILANSLVPAGSTMGWAGAAAPTGWLLADGAAVSRTTYARLFAAIGTTYGSGNGSTTFNVPNLKGRVLVGFDSGQSEFNALGETGGEKTHTLTSSEMPAHTHSGPSHTHTESVHTHATPGVADVAPGSGTQQLDANPFPTGPNHFSTTTSAGGGQTGSSGTGNTGSTGSGNAHNILQPYIAMNYIIKV